MSATQCESKVEPDGSTTHRCVSRDGLVLTCKISQDGRKIDCERYWQILNHVFGYTRSSGTLDGAKSKDDDDKRSDRR